MTTRALLLSSIVLLIPGGAWAQAPIRGFPAGNAAAESELEQKAKALPSAEQLKAYMQGMASKPHTAGSEGSKAVAEYAAAQMRSWGLDVQIEIFEPLLPYPTVRLLEIPGSVPFHAQLSEPSMTEDADTASANQVPPYNAYSASGDVTAPMVYVNYGTPEDYAQLEAQGISVQGKIVIARYGRVWRGLKPKLAQDRGAVGCLIYSDPADDGYSDAPVFPSGPMRNTREAQQELDSGCVGCRRFDDAPFGHGAYACSGERLTGCVGIVCDIAPDAAAARSTALGRGCW